AAGGLTGGRADVVILPRNRRAGAAAGHRLAGLEGALRAADRDVLVVGHRHVRQGHVTAVGHRVGPGHRDAHRDRRAGGGGDALAVGVLLDLDRRVDVAEVPALVRIRDRRPGGRGPGGGAGVVVLAGHGRAVAGAGHLLPRRQGRLRA